MNESWHEIELKKNLEFLGGTSDVDEYIQVAYFRIGHRSNFRVSKLFNEQSMCLIRNLRQCICSKKKLYHLYFIKRIGFLDPKYPYIMIGSKCIDRFQTQHAVETLEGNTLNSHINCELCLEYFIKRGGNTLCYDCRNFYTPDSTLSIGKYKSKTFDYVYNNDENYCNFIVEKFSDYHKWKNFSSFIIGCREIERRLFKKSKKECVEPLTTEEVEYMIKEDDWPLDKTYNLYTPVQMIKAFVNDSTHDSEDDSEDDSENDSSE